MNIDLLKKIGLTENEVRVYDLLLTFQELPPTEIAERLEITRTNSYAVLKSLTKKGLIREKIKHKKLVYSASAPENLHIYAKDKLKELESNVAGVELYLPEIKKRYEMMTNQEGSRHYTGIEGLEMVFTDILREEDNLYIITSNYENRRKSVLEAYKNHFRRTEKRNLKVKVLVPFAADFSYKFFNKFAQNSDLVEIKKFTKKVFNLDSTIFIYGKNLAIISLKNDFATVQIDNGDMAQTFKTIFLAFWKDS